MALRKFAFFLAAWALAACAVLYFTPPARAGWGGGACGPVGPEVVFAAAPVAVPHRYEWREYTDHPDWNAGFVQLWDATADRQAGAWRRSDHSFHWLVSDNTPPYFGGACPPPIAPPADPPPLPGDKLPTGVIPERISVQERYTINGREVAGADAARAIEGPDGKIPDDSAKPSLTAIGTPEECAKVKADMQAAGVLDLVVWQDYRPTDVMVAKYGFVTDGHPAVHLETPGGTDLYPHGQYDAATLAEAVRKADPNYDPKKVQPATPADPISALVAEIVVEVEKVPNWVWVGVLVLLFFSMRRRQ